MRNKLGITVVLVLCVVAGVFMGCDREEMSREEIANRFHSDGFDKHGQELPYGKEVPWKNDGESWWGREGMKMPGSSEETESNDAVKEELFPWQNEGESLWEDGESDIENNLSEKSSN
ncbi:MAG: hypothetical protein R2883_00735 [Caldisericia bacterium]